MGDVDEPLAIDAGAAAAIAEWYALGWRALDTTLTVVPRAAGPAVIQLWPEHFDAGTNVGTGWGERVNLGASPGDAFCEEPYLYVGPWSERRPGDPAYWNAPFGAVMRRCDLLGRGDPAAAAAEFLRSGLERLA
jgi:hypothetical protein